MIIEISQIKFLEVISHRAQGILKALFWQSSVQQVAPCKLYQPPKVSDMAGTGCGHLIYEDKAYTLMDNVIMNQVTSKTTRGFGT